MNVNDISSIIIPTSHNDGPNEPFFETETIIKVALIALTLFVSYATGGLAALAGSAGACSVFGALLYYDRTVSQLDLVEVEALPSDKDEVLPSPSTKDDLQLAQLLGQKIDLEERLKTSKEANDKLNFEITELRDRLALLTNELIKSNVSSIASQTNKVATTSLEKQNNTALNGDDDGFTKNTLLLDLCKTFNLCTFNVAQKGVLQSLLKMGADINCKSGAILPMLIEITEKELASKKDALVFKTFVENINWFIKLGYRVDSNSKWLKSIVAEMPKYLSQTQITEILKLLYGDLSERVERELFRKPDPVPVVPAPKKSHTSDAQAQKMYNDLTSRDFEYSDSSARWKRLDAYSTGDLSVGNCHKDTAGKEKSLPVLLACLKKGHLQACEELFPVVEHIGMQHDADNLGVLSYSLLATLHAQPNHEFSTGIVENFLRALTLDIAEKRLTIEECMPDLACAWVLSFFSPINCRDQIAALINQKKGLLTFDLIEQSVQLVLKNINIWQYLYLPKISVLDTLNTKMVRVQMKINQIEKQLKQDLMPIFKSQGLALKMDNLEKEKWLKEQLAEIEAIDPVSELFRMLMTFVSEPRPEQFGIEMIEIKAIFSEFIDHLNKLYEVGRLESTTKEGFQKYQENWALDLKKIWVKKHGDYNSKAFEKYVRELISSVDFGKNHMPLEYMTARELRQVKAGTLKRQVMLSSKFLKYAVNLIGHFKNEEAITGTPLASDPVKLIQFYTQLKHKLRRLIYCSYKAKEADAKVRAFDEVDAFGMLKSLVYSKQQCAANWSNDIEQMYTLAVFNSTGDSFPVKSKKAVDKFKIDVIEEWVRDYCEKTSVVGMQVHYRRAIIQNLGETFGLAERGEVVEDYESEMVRSRFDEIQQYFWSKVTKESILNFVKQQLGKGGMLNKHEAIDWIKHNFTGEWKKKEFAAEEQKLISVYEGYLKEIGVIGDGGLSQEEMADHLFERLQKAGLSDEHTNIDLSRLKERIKQILVENKDDHAKQASELKKVIHDAAEQERTTACYGSEMIVPATGAIKDTVLLRALLFDGL